MAVALDDVQWQVGGEYINAGDIGFWNVEGEWDKSFTLCDA